ncbi:Cytochrome P450 86B1 [Camellia lanceoleosa]|uniref:Cytochrome P450 86B1 n=1 Tax=Camellia lanceoleosa TaxID=1840588 RepID=A0ACC0J2E6_9ERIC|nr:Cytochrome P450 86B1 [Camellia lanceoleosa]
MELASFWDATDSSLPCAPDPRLGQSSMPSRSYGFDCSFCSSVIGNGFDCSFCSSIASVALPSHELEASSADTLSFINSDSDMWRNQRKLAQLQLSHPWFHQLLVKTTQDKVEKGLIKVLEHVSKQSLVVDLQDLFQRLRFDTT